MEKYGRSFKDLNNKEKVDYVIEYYKYHIIGGLVLVYVIYGILNHYVINPPKKIVLDITVLSAYVLDDDFEALREKVVTYVESKYDDKTGDMEHLIFGSKQNEDPQINIAMTTKLMGKFAAGDIDIIITNEEHYDMLVEEESLLPLDELLASDQFERLKKDMVYEKIGGQTRPCALALTKEHYIYNLLEANTPMYLGVIITSDQKELIGDIFDILLDNVEIEAERESEGND